MTEQRATPQSLFLFFVYLSGEAEFLGQFGLTVYYSVVVLKRVWNDGHRCLGLV
jgi:hypothetical protein